MQQRSGFVVKEAFDKSVIDCSVKALGQIKKNMKHITELNTINNLRKQ